MSMKTSSGPATAQRQLVDRIAGHIRDPITRLRFLKMMAPSDRRGKRWWSRKSPAGVDAAPPALGTQRAVWGASGDATGRAPWWKGWAPALLTLAAGLGTLLIMGSRPRPGVPPAENASARPHPLATTRAAAGTPPDVWLVETKAEMETYSNGLQIDVRFTSGTHRRSYLAFPEAGGAPVRREEPVGIVFHTTESQQAPFEPSANGTLKRIGESLLEYVRRKQAYNFVIDRFGRVFRVVPEGDAANHSGHSAWADRDYSYINLNESFLAIAFEAASPRPAREAQINPAQVRAAGILLEWLRGRYHIAAANCVVHAQVSVNPSAMLVGVHVDWATGFPFAEIGLPDNYVQPLPAIWAYGFDCDADFTGKAGLEMRAGIDAGRAVLAGKAEENGVSPEQYRKSLRQRYRAMSASVANANR